MRIVIAIFLVFACFFQAQSEQYYFRNITVEDGLAQNTVLSVYQDKRGNIWAATNGGGVSKYNGHSIINYSKKDGLASDVVFSVMEDRTGRIWIATNDGISIYDGLTFTNYTVDDGLSDNQTYSFWENQNGSILIATAKGVTVYKNNAFSVLEVDSVLSESRVWSINQDNKGNHWFCTINSGVIKLSPAGEIRQFNESNGLYCYGNRANTIFNGPGDTLWVGTNRGLNTIYEDQIVDTVLLEPGASLVTIMDITSAPDGTIWLGTYSGAYKHLGGWSFKKYTEDMGLPNNKIWKLIVDREQNVWFGTYGAGLATLNSERFANYNHETDSIAGDNIFAIHKDKNGIVWIGTDKSGISWHKFNEQNRLVDYAIFKRNPKNPDPNGISGNSIYSIHEDIDNNELWFGNYGNGIDVFDVNTRKKKFSLTTKDGLSHDWIFKIIEDSQGRKWIGTSKGVTVIQGDSIWKFDEIDTYVKNDEIWDIYEDTNKHIWFASDKGVIKYDGNSLQYFAKKDGFTDGRVRNIEKDQQGNLWFGTTDGLFRYDGKQFDNVSVQDGLSSNNIYLTILDNANTLWVGTNKGVDKLDITKYNESKEAEIRHFGKKEGFLGVECNLNAVYADDDGTIWFGTTEGVTVYRPQFDHINRKEPITYITNIKLDHRDVDWSPYTDSLDPHTRIPIGLNLPYDKNHLIFEFIGVSLTVPEKVRYQYMLEGLDEHWTPITNKTEATYSNVPPGNTYTFKVRARNNDGLWNEQAVVFSNIVIKPPFWQTWWFYTIVILLIVIGIYLFIVIRTRNLQRAKQMLEEQVRIRTRQLRKEKEKVERFNEEILVQNKIIETKNKDITDSINYAKRIQEAILPSLDEINNTLKKSFVLYLPKDIVSGDFYWFSSRNGKTYIAAVDCTGHGVPGAFMSMIGNSLLDQIIIENRTEEPGKILKQLNMGIKSALRVGAKDKEMDTNDGMDLALCAIDESNGKLEFAGAMRPLYLLKKDAEEVEEVKGTKRAIGGRTEDNFEFETVVLNFEEGDAFYISSDGYADQFGGKKGKKFMTKKFKNMLVEIRDKQMAKQKDIMYQRLRDWMGDEEQIDDVLVIGVQR